jgi:hypothetical protein
VHGAKILPFALPSGLYLQNFLGFQQTKNLALQIQCNMPEINIFISGTQEALF